MSLWTSIRGSVEHLDPATAALTGNDPRSALAGPLQGWLHKGKPQDTASAQLAQLYADQWQDYLTRFAPEENRQLGLMSPGANEQERNSAVGAVNSAYARSAGDYARQAVGYGIDLTPQQKQSYAQRTNTQQGLDKTTAYNRTAQMQQDRAYGALPTFVAPQVGGAAGISGTSGSLGGYQ